MCRIDRVLSFRLSVAAMLILFSALVMEATVTYAQKACTDNEIWSVFPTSKDLGDVNDQLLTKSGPTLNKDGTRTFSMRWQGAATSRSVSVTLTEYPDPKWASKKVHEYGFDNMKGQTKTGMVKLSFGDEGYKTDDIKRPYYLVHKGQFALSYYTSYPGRGGGIPGNQDPTVEKIIKKIAALPCLGITVKPPPPPPPPPINNCPKVTLTALPHKATLSQTIKLVAKATDPEGDPLTMKWSATDSQGKSLKVAWNGKVVRRKGLLADTVSWKNPPIGQYRIVVEVSDGKCGKTKKMATSVLVQAGMTVSVATDKKTYSPGETVVIKGSVRDEKGGLDGATVVIDVGGTKLSATTDSSGNYECKFPIPSPDSQINYKVIAKASYSGYPDKIKSTSFSVGQALIVEISTDKIKCESFLFPLVGEIIYCTITVKNGATGELVPLANLKVITTTTAPDGEGWGKVTELSGATDGLGENTWSFTLKKRLRIEVTASKEGYVDGHKSIIFPEDCFWSPDVCKCGRDRICDPWSIDADLFGCSPKMAYIIVATPKTNALQRMLWSKYIKEARSLFKKFGYKNVKYTYLSEGKKPKISPLRILSNPSTKAIAYFGHAVKPSISGLGSQDIALMIWKVLYKRYQRQGMGEKESDARATEDAWQLDLDHAYIYTCFSLKDKSLADFLLSNERGGEYWGSYWFLLGWGEPLAKYDKLPRRKR